MMLPSVLALVAAKSTPAISTPLIVAASLSHTELSTMFANYSAEQSTIATKSCQSGAAFNHHCYIADGFISLLIEILSKCWYVDPEFTLTDSM